MADTATPADGYRAFHARRFRYLCDLVEHHLPSGEGRVLDIGLSPFTDILRRRINVPVDTLGLETVSRDPKGQHFPFDLNALAEPDRPRPALPPYRLIVFAEVLEHLHIAPGLALAFLRERLVPGGILIVQTPNAASLNKRLKLLAGRHPYEMIRSDRANPGHFREYTLQELQELAAGAGFSVVGADRRSYFDARFAHHHEDGSAGTPQPVWGTIKNLVYSVVPGSLREGMTLVLRRTSN